MQWTHHDLQVHDVIVPTRVARLRFGPLIVGDDELTYDGRTFRCQDVRAISLDWLRVNKVGVGVNHSMEIQFRLPGMPKRVSLSTNRIFVVYHSFHSIQHKHIALFSIFAHLCKQSFDNRLSEYLLRLANDGRIAFEDCHLLANGTLLQGRVAIDLNDPLTRVHSEPSELYFWKTGTERTGFLKWLLGPWTYYVCLDQSIDRDVIRAIISGMFKTPLDD